MARASASARVRARGRARVGVRVSVRVRARLGFRVGVRDRGMLTVTLTLTSTPNPKPDRFQALGRSPRLHLCAFASDSSERRHAGSALRRALAAETRTFVDISELSDAEAP